MAIVEASAKSAGLPAVIASRLTEVRRRESQIKLLRGAIGAVALALALLCAALVLDWMFNFFDSGVRTAVRNVTLGLGAVGILLLIVGPQLRRRALADLAAAVDRSVPRLEERWQTVSSLSKSTDPEAVSGSRTMFERVLAESVALEHLVEPSNVFPLRGIGWQKWFLAGALAAILGLFVLDAPHAWVLFRRFCSPTAPISLTQVSAAAGDLTVARGERLRLEATVARRLPGKAQLFLRNSDGTIKTLPLLPDFTDRTRFGYAIESADQPFSYRFRAGDGQTDWHEVAVFDRPRLSKIDFTLTPPAYTKLPAVTRSDLPANARAVEGTELSVEFTVDQPLRQFDIDLGENSTLRLTPVVGDSERYVFRRRLDQSLRFAPVFVSQQGLANLRYPHTQITVYPDRPPEVVISSPSKEISVRPDDKVTVEIQAHDDFGVVRAEIVAFTGEKPDFENATPVTPTTAAAQSPNTQHGQNAAQSRNAEQTQSATQTQTATQAQQQPQKTSEPANDAKSDPSANNDRANGEQTAPPKTFVLPIPLADQAGKQKVRARVDLDLKQFDLKQGQELRYLVRVFDSKEGSSKASPQATPRDQAQAQQLAERERRSPSTREEGPERASKAQPAASPPSSSQASASSERQTPPSQYQENRSSGSSEQSASQEKPKKDAAKPKPAPAPAPSTPQEDNPKTEAQLASTQRSKGEPKPSQGETTGARPNDPMPKRYWDIDSQSASSSTMRIHIDKWAGSFEGQQRQKLEVLIDPVLKALDAALAKAIEELSPVSQALAQSKAPAALDVKVLRSVETHILRAQSLVGDLVQKTDNTPYAFVGLQLVDITELHISPARADVREIKPEAADRLQKVQSAETHLKRAREMLADLTRKYETVQRDLKLAEEMQRIKKMYQVFVEETMAMLGSSRPEINSRGRRMDELELDEEFLKKYAELLKRWEETLAELAKVLGKDPRLLARYMNTSRRSADSLRDQLTLLHRRQEELLASVTQLKNEPRTDASKPSATAKAVQERLQQELLEIASQAAAIPEDFNTWLPAGVKADDQSIKALREDAARIATTATLATSAPSSGDKGPTSVQKVNELVTQLTKFEAALENRTSGAEPALTQHLRRRLAQVRKIEQQAAVWTEKQDHIKANRLNRAIEVDQHRLSEETLSLAGKLENLQAQLAGLPDEAAAQIQKMGAELTDGIKYDVLVAEMSAELGLRDGLLGVAGEQQRKAVDEFARAEERFDKLINRIIEEQDKVPAQVPDIDQIQLQTLEDLLAQLEREPDFGDLLGVPDRMINLQQFRDWLGRSRGSGGSNGSSGRRRSPQAMADRAREQARLAEQARRNALRAVQNAQKTAPKPTTRMASHWNTLGSRLEDAVRQGRGNTPPRQYRQPIERYFELISRSPNGSENADPAAKKPLTPTAAQGGDTNGGTSP